MAKANQAAKKAGAKKAAVVRSPAVTQAKIAATPETALYAVLEPFKFRGAIVKPGVFIEMTAGEAEVYQDAGVLGTEPTDVPETNDDSGDEGGTDNETAN